MVPIGALKQPDWPQFRARIWNANRIFIAVGATLSTSEIVNATLDGAQDVVDLKDDDERWDESLEKADASQKLWLQLYGTGPKSNTGGILLGESSAMRSLRQTVERIGPTGATVLVLASKAPVPRPGT